MFENFRSWDKGNELQGNQLKTTVKVKVKFSLQQAMKAQRGSRGIALLFL
jgi:hypothetical protein